MKIDLEIDEQSDKTRKERERERKQKAGIWQALFHRVAIQSRPPEVPDESAGALFVLVTAISRSSVGHFNMCQRVTHRNNLARSSAGTAVRG